VLDRIAVLSDVHGNLTAFEAVLADIAARGITRVVNLGDIVGKGPRGSACVGLTRSSCEATVHGNWEAFLLDPASDLDPACRWWTDELGDDDRSWLRALPFHHDLVLSGRLVRLVHANTDDVFHRLHGEHSWDDFRDTFEPRGATAGLQAPDVVGYGDIHGTYLQGDDNRTLFNTGSVGNPLDGQTASYAVLEGVEGSGNASDPFSVAFARVTYDIEAELAVAERLGMPDLQAWSVELRTGVYRFHQ
jgi:predicted phosphodiesterase